MLRHEERADTAWKAIREGYNPVRTIRSVYIGAHNDGIAFERARTIAVLRKPPEDLQEIMAEALIRGDAEEGPGYAGAVALYVADAIAGWLEKQDAKAT